MPRARKHLVSLDSTPYYHVYSRCVRRAFLCGEDRLTGQSFEHRRSWLEDRVRFLSTIFCVEICSYAIMSNHYHLVVKLVPEDSQCWSTKEVLARWAELYRGPILMQRHLQGEALSAAELLTLESIARVYRKRLTSLSWFMKCLNEPIARQANAEDGCTGHFWEARFQSQALVSERALIAAMAYVDLNPVRAGIAPTPESSHYTSLRSRLTPQTRFSERWDKRLRSLMPFAGESGNRCLPVRKQEYLRLVGLAGRSVKQNKAVPSTPALISILDRLGLSQSQWIASANDFRMVLRRGDLQARKTA